MPDVSFIAATSSCGGLPRGLSPHGRVVRPSLVVLSLWLSLSACSEPMRPDDAGPYDDLADRRIDAATDGTLRDVRFFDIDPDAPIFTDAGCGAVYQRHNEDPGMHVAPDAAIHWNTEPPSSGDHFEEWAQWGPHREVVPRGYWVHNLEHGGVVVLYRCLARCDDLRARLETFIARFEPEPSCVGQGYPRRILLTEDPLLDVPVAAAAWGWTYRATCLDEDSLEAFVRRRTGLAPKPTCLNGSFPGPAFDR